MTRVTSLPYNYTTAMICSHDQGRRNYPPPENFDRKKLGGGVTPPTHTPPKFKLSLAAYLTRFPRKF